AEADADKNESADEFIIDCVIDGRYRVLRRLGSGGVGAVYQAEHVDMRRPVALKMLHSIFASAEDFKKRFEREARAASRLQHPGCVSVLDYGRLQRVESGPD